MKKIVIIMLFFLLIIPVNAKEIEAGTKTSYYFSTTQKIVKEVMKEYYLRGENIQYSASRIMVPGMPPEDATSQDRQYHNCVNFYYNVLYEAFHMNKESKHPITSTMDGLKQARNYYNNYIKGKENDSKYASYRDGHFLLFYQSKKTSKLNAGKYIYKNNYDFSSFVKLLQPGDIIEWKSESNAGHYALIYSLVKDSSGKVVDAALLNSTGYATIPSRLYGVRNLRYIYKTPMKNNTINIDVEGTIQLALLSKSTRIVENEKIVCAKDEECMIIRPYYNVDGKTVFNYDITTEAYLRSFLRTKYPGLMIEKTVDKMDNNGVYPNDTLTYSIKITNKSNVTNKGKDSIKYEKFTIKEEINPELVGNFKSSDCTISGKEITCVVNGLEAGKSKTIKYSLKVKNKPGKEIKATGKLYGSFENTKNSYIPTGTVINKILPEKKDYNYKNCFDDGVKKNQTGLTLINYVYKCATGKDYHFDFFNFLDMFVRYDNIDSKTGKKTMFIDFNSKMNNNTKLYKNMILNNYWSATSYMYNYLKNDRVVIPKSWTASDVRKRFINRNDLIDGDLLIYYVNYKKALDGNTYVTKDSDIHTKENGYYAYIYLDGKFVGINYPNKENERNEFTYQYYNKVYGSNGYTKHLYSKYNEIPDKEKNRILTIANYETLLDKDYYVILRPSIVMNQVERIEIEKIPTKTNYIQNQENLVLTGGKLKIYYKDKTTKLIDLTSNEIKITGFNNSKIGENIITVSYDNKTTTFKVNIIASNNEKLKEEPKNEPEAPKSDDPISEPEKEEPKKETIDSDSIDKEIKICIIAVLIITFVIIIIKIFGSFKKAK